MDGPVADVPEAAKGARPVRYGRALEDWTGTVNGIALDRHGIVRLGLSAGDVDFE